MERSAVLQRKRNSGGGKIYLTEYVAKALKLKYRKVLHTKETKDLRFCSWLSNSEKIIKRNKIKDMTQLELVCRCTKDTDKRLREGFSCHNAFYQPHHPAEVRAGKCGSPRGPLRRTLKVVLPWRRSRRRLWQH